MDFYTSFLCVLGVFLFAGLFTVSLTTEDACCGVYMVSSDKYLKYVVEKTKRPNGDSTFCFDIVL